MKWLPIVLALLLALPASSQDKSLTPEERAGVSVAGACAELWVAKTADEVNRLRDLIVNRYNDQSFALAPAYRTSMEAYDAARDEYEAAYTRISMSIMSMGGTATDFAAQGFLEENKPRSPEETDDWLDDMIAAGPKAVANALALAEESSKYDDLLLAQLDYKRRLLATRESYLKVLNEMARLEAIIELVDVCVADQIAYLTVFAPKTDAETQAPAEPAPPAVNADLPVVGTMRAAGLGFTAVPYNLVEVPQPPGGPKVTSAPYWPEACRDICMADSQCVAWNYVHPLHPGDPMPPAMCEFFHLDDKNFRGTSLTDSKYRSGFGPAAVSLGVARLAN